MRDIYREQKRADPEHNEYGALAAGYENAVWFVHWFSGLWGFKKAVMALAALYWAVAGPFAAARTDLVAWEARESTRTGSTWSLATDTMN